jgi:signal transduction histidine kinase
VKRAGGIPQLPSWARYVAAVGLTVAVILARLALDPWWGHHQNRHLVFLPTVMLAAWLGGLGSGLVSAFLCTVAIDYFWTDPRYVFFHPSFELILFFLVAVAMSKLIDSLREARARADAARISGEQVLAIVAHDLRSPLATIKVTSQLIRRKAGDPEQLRQKLDTIDRAVDRSDKLISDLVDATRAEQGELSMVLEPEHLAPIVDEILDVFGPLAREKNIHLEAPAPVGDVAVRCDRNRLLQVLGNLLSNAIKFTPEGGRIALAVRSDDGSVQFEVSDSGTGISPEHLPHIFERYWYADRRGTGLGLFIAQSIVRAHGGGLRVRSEQGVGTTFSFSLPRSTSVPKDEPSRERTASRPRNDERGTA